MVRQFDITNPDFRSTRVEVPHWDLLQIKGFTDPSSISASARHLVTSGSQTPAWTEDDIRALREIIGVVEEL